MICVEKKTDDGLWDETVCSLGGNLQHSCIYARYVLASNPNAEPCFMSLRDQDGNLLGMAVTFEERSPRKLIGALTGRVWLETLPLVRSAAKRELLGFLTDIEQHARRTGNTMLEVHSAASRGGREELAELGFQLRHRLEFELDLQPSEDELWKNMEYKRRKNIKKATRLGVVIRDLTGDAGIAELRRLQGASSARIVARGGPDITRQHSLERDPIRVLLDAGVGRIVIAELEDEIVSASLFTSFNGKVYHTLSGHSNEGTKAQAPTLLLWETIKRYRQEGVGRFNFGGCSASAVDKDSPEYGVYSYKKAFGGECIECTSGRKVLAPLRNALISTMKQLAGRR
jgi:hypothetical protein